MAEQELRSGLGRAKLDYIVTTIDDPGHVRELLRPRVEYTAYALGQLEPGLVEKAHWYSARGDSGTGITVHSHGGLGNATLVAGDPGAVAAILSLYPGASQTYVTFQPQHDEAMRSVYWLSNHIPMIRMAVSRENFVAAAGATVGLTGSDIRRINGLYSSGGGPSYYSPEHIDSGVYQGVSVEGRLVAIAGTHVVSRSEGVAVVGNVLTHPAHRNRGYGRLATSAVTERLLRLCPDIVLTVDPHNKPAIRAYERLGYREACQLIESTARRRDLTGIQSMLRRAVASIRGRKYGGSFVSRSL